jgi:hypothetical protein
MNTIYLEDCQFVRLTGHQCQYTLKVEEAYKSTAFKCTWKHKCPHKGDKTPVDAIKIEKDPF